jgi:hypothetical protein
MPTQHLFPQHLGIPLDPQPSLVDSYGYRKYACTHYLGTSYHGLPSASCHCATTDCRVLAPSVCSVLKLRYGLAKLPQGLCLQLSQPGASMLGLQDLTVGQVSGENFHLQTTRETDTNLVPMHLRYDSCCCLY